MVTPTQILSLKQAAEYLNIGENLAYRMVRAGKLPAVMCGNRYRIPLVALNGMLQNNTLLYSPKFDKGGGNGKQ